MANKILKNIISVIAIIVLCGIGIARFYFISTVSTKYEKVIMNVTSSIEITIYLVIDLLFIFAFKIMKDKLKLNKNIKRIILVLCIFIYGISSAIWVKNSDIIPVDDSKSVNELAISYANGDMEKLEKSGYLEKYPNQMGTVLIIGTIYKIFRTTNFRLIQYINIIANILTFIFMYLILGKMQKKYNVSKAIYTAMYLTFIPLILLTTYVYGDYIGLAFSAMGIYFIMDYKKDGKIYKLIISSIAMCLSYITKMNYIIFTLAIIIYLGFYLIQDIENKNKQKIIKSIFSLIVFILIAIMPFSIIKNYYKNKYNYKAEEALPTTVWVYVGMMESGRANGWYSGVTEEAWENTPLAHTTYNQKIKERLKEFVKNPKYTVRFYFWKTISGWTDPYFQSIWYNVGLENKDEKLAQIFDSKKYKMCELYLKASMTLMYGGAFLAAIKNRKNMSNEMMLLVVIFIGGVLFHTIWEMKTRYTLPYAVILMPVSAIGLQWAISKISKEKKINKTE